jgi:hypothetical protein
VGANCWLTKVPWRPNLAGALAAARANAYAQVPKKQRDHAEALSISQLLVALELDRDDDPDYAAWSSWLAAASPETRYVVALGPNGSGTILDIDHAAATTLARGSIPSVPGGPMLALAATEPGLGTVRWATAQELLDRYETEKPTTIGDGEEWWDSLERGEAIAVTRWDGDRPIEIVFIGVTGD